MKIYLASPLGFAASTAQFMEELAASLSQHVEVINPWDDHRFDDEFARAQGIADRSERLAVYYLANTELGRSNAASITGSDGVVAVLDGVDVDSGTASEIGFAFAKGKRIYGLRTDFRLAGDNEGSIVNLQVQYFIEASGGEIHTVVDGLVEAVHAWAAGSEQG
ncbi:nucleoside 2-deoxyribosyltransferase [soil metagenome]